jgi:peptidoglycan/xylan/chitin deacetylase (PgdA/CDA1 family)
VIASSFDDGPKTATGEVLDALRDQKVKATFFLCAIALEAHGDVQYGILKRMIFLPSSSRSSR